MRYRHISTEIKVCSNVCNYCIQRVILFIELAMAGTKTYGLFTECVDFVHNHKAVPIFRRWTRKTILVLYSNKYGTCFDTVIHFRFLYFPKLSLSFSLYILSFPLLSLFILLTPSVVRPEKFRGFKSCLYCSIPEVFRAAFSAHYGHARNIPGPILFMLKWFICWMKYDSTFPISL